MSCGNKTESPEAFVHGVATIAPGLHVTSRSKSTLLDKSSIANNKDAPDCGRQRYAKGCVRICSLYKPKGETPLMKMNAVKLISDL